MIRGLGGHREGQGEDLGGGMVSKMVRRQEQGSARPGPLISIKGAGGLFALRGTRRGHWRLGGLDAKKLRG